MHKILGINDMVDGISIFNCGFEFQTSYMQTHVKQHKVAMAERSSSAAQMGQFRYRIIGRQKQTVKC